MVTATKAQDPDIAKGEERIDDTKEGKRKTRALHARLQAVERQVGPWRIWLKTMWERRYGYGERGGDDPWPGASDVIYPVSDMHIARVKPPLLTMLFGGPKVSAMRARNMRDMKNFWNASAAMEHIVRGGGPHAMPNLIEQMAYGIEDAAWSGVGTWLSYYEKAYEIRRETLRRKELPGVLGMLVVMPDIGPRERRDMMARFQGLNHPGLLMALEAPGPVQPMDRATFRQYAKKIREIVRGLYNLSEDDKYDQKALAEIMDWIGSGFKEPEVTVLTNACVADRPNVRAISPFDMIVPPGARMDFTRADMAGVVLHLTESEVLARAAASEWTDKAVDALLGGSGPSSLSENSPVSTPFLRWGQWNPDATRDKGIYDVVQMWHREVMGKDEPPRLVVTLLEPSRGLVLRSSTAVRGIPLTTWGFESNADGFYDSRGVLEILWDCESHMTAELRAIENNLRLTTTPMFKYRKNLFPDWENVRFIPGEGVAVNRPDDVEQFPMVSNVIPLHQLMGALKTWPEELVGTMDVAGTAPARLFEPRSATETSGVINNQKTVLGMRAMLLREAFSRILQQSFELFRTYGPTKFWASVMGEDPVYLSQDQIRGQYDVSPVGALGDMDPNYRLQRAQMRYGFLQQAKPLLDADPRIRVDWTEAALQVLEADDMQAIRRIIQWLPDDQVKARVQQIQQQAQAQAQLGQLADQAIANAPTDLMSLKKLAIEVERRMPHKGLQEISGEGAAATQQAQYAAMLSGATG